jgi:hypothetical protein
VFPDQRHVEGAFYQRRHSFNVLGRNHVRRDCEDLDESKDWPWNQYHLQILPDYRCLREWYRKDNIEVYTAKNKKLVVHIVKDFREQDYDNVSK